MHRPYTQQITAGRLLCTASEQGLEEAMLYSKLTGTTVHTIQRRTSIRCVH